MTTEIQSLITPFFTAFARLIKRHVLLHFLFIFLLLAELALLIAFFSYFIDSSLLAFAFGLIFFTGSSYFILRLSSLEKKSKKFASLCNRYIGQCKETMNYQDGVAEHHISLANSCSKLAVGLQGKEYQFYRLPRWLDTLSSTMEKLSCWWHWHDFFRMKELLLRASVLEHIKLVKCEPTSLELHTALANAYVMLSGLYVDPRNIPDYEDDRWIPHGAFNELMEKKFRKTAEKAIEEFKILEEYAPDDPWIHTQLAYSYHDLQMPEKEIREYEIVVQLKPDDQDALYKLGILYFQQGMNARGLQIYEKLKQTHFKKAEDLIHHYNAVI